MSLDTCSKRKTKRACCCLRVAFRLRLKERYAMYQHSKLSKSAACTEKLKNLRSVNALGKKPRGANQHVIRLA